MWSNFNITSAWPLNRRISIAPMMDCTHRHFRMLARCLSQHTLLYTEMLTTAAILHGNRETLLGFDAREHPVGLQLGGSDPQALAQCARIAYEFGYDEVNLNVGCPSDRVQAGCFGACLMLEPKLVAECVAAIQQVVPIPVTVKTRLGVDEYDDDVFLRRFVDLVRNAGCKTFIIHARKAWLKGLSPRENREVPPLQYERVYALKRDYPQLEIIINGGIHTISEMQQHLSHVDGVMLGREPYAHPYVMATFDREFYESDLAIPSRSVVLKEYIHYVHFQLAKGVPLRFLVRHLVGLFHGVVGARGWRRFISERLNELANEELFLQQLSGIFEEL